MSQLTRRSMLKTSLVASGAILFPSILKGRSPNEKICTAHIGIGGKGRSDLANLAGHPNVEVVGLCDVDMGLRDKALGRHPSATFFQDYREMLEQLGDKVDAVSVSTPDHTHYPATLAAMNLGKHVYTQKPLTHAIAEARHLQGVAEENSLVTQMGIQNHASLAYRAATRAIQNGVIGKVSKVYAWSHKNWGDDGPPYRGDDAVPANLDWNLWLGTAKERPYLSGKYHAKQWRRILDFGCGTIGDMGVHIIDTPFRALELRPAISAEASCRAPNGFSHPEQGIVHFGFAPTRFTTENFSFTWYDGALAPPATELPLASFEAQDLPNQGSLFIGEKGQMLLPHCAPPSFYPASLGADVDRADLGQVDHYHQFVNAIQGSDSTSADFAYSVPIMETLHLGVIAAHFPGNNLEWNSQEMKVTNEEEANALVTKDYRAF